MQKPKIIVVVGQTGTGKSNLAMFLAKKLDGEIISADSRAIYKGMDIGTAKPSIKDQQAIPHHLIDVIDPSSSFTASDYKNLAQKAIKDINKRDKIPILVGGSGLYINSVIYDYTFSRQAQRDPKNPRHLIKQDNQPKKILRPNTLLIGLSLNKDLLRKRLIKRVNSMVEEGLIDEVKNLNKTKSINKELMKTPAYRSMKQYIDGTISLDDAKLLCIQYDLNLAKRQETWFKRNNSIHWIKNREEALLLAKDFLNTISE